MASINTACRLTAYTIRRQLKVHGSVRGFSKPAQYLAAHNFAMPAMSPTMTEGNITSWRVKEGETFSAGDVLLEIETDKAQMDVEAQDDGVLFKIVQGEGTKGVQVGSRIAVLAEQGDNLESLVVPPDDSKPSVSGEPHQEDKLSSQDENLGAIGRAGNLESAVEELPSPKPYRHATVNEAANARDTQQIKGLEKSEAAQPSKQIYPLYPSVQHLLHEKGLTKQDADKIPATGPNGRLLKGDVLAYLGRIDKTHPFKLSQRIAKLSHLDFSNITKMEPERKAPPQQPKQTEPRVPLLEPDLEVAVTISFKATLECQKRIQDSLGVSIPLSTFIEKASKFANKDLPRSKSEKPSSDELFDAVLGLDKIPISRTSRGHFIPQITALPPTRIQPLAPLKAKQPDILDILAGKSASRSSPVSRPVVTSANGFGPMNVFSVSVHKGDEKRARVFLQRIKTALEAEPGQLVL